MIKLVGSEDYYPTPDSLLKEILSDIDWDLVENVLEPSAGRGNICDYMQKAKERSRSVWKEYAGEGIDCIEIEPELRAILKDKKYRVVHDDFLTFHTYKHYDLIVMNPPFSGGARHLLKAIDIQSTTGGVIVCILNAETIRNAYTNERKELAKRLKEYGAEISYYENAFKLAERSTDVEVAVVKVKVPVSTHKSTIFDTLREKDYEEYEKKSETSELAESDIVRALVAQYNRELEWGLRLCGELLELESKSLDGRACISMNTCRGEYSCDREDFTVNGYVRAVRHKYWEKFFAHPVFYSKLTSNLAQEYTSRVDKFEQYDFSYWNIKSVQEEIAKSLIKGVEDCILGLFDELSHKHSWSENLQLDNIHYYNGWKTNLSWKINKKVIIPLWAFRRSWDEKTWIFDPTYEVYSKLSDIEKVLNYLDNGETEEIDLECRLRIAKDIDLTKKIQCKYFNVTFYKKGTCHIEFTNERLLKKFNIFGSQRKGWLPYGYAYRRYEEFTPEEQEVIESFEGREAYNDTLMDTQYYLFDASHSIPMLTA